jgi:hypothetical protein
VSETNDRSAISQVIRDIAGPVATELGEMLRNEVRPYRIVREAKLMEKTERMVLEAGFNPKAVAPKLFLTIVDNAGIEDDEDLHTKWAALLANAADSSREAEIPIVYPEILRQLSPIDAQFVRGLLSAAVYPHPPNTPRQIERRLILDHNLGTTRDLFQRFVELMNADQEDFRTERLFDTSVGNIVRLNLLRVSRETIAVPERMRPQDIPHPAADYYYLTGLGLDFLKACEPPEKRRLRKEP